MRTLRSTCAALAATCVLALAGCAGLPKSGPVTSASPETDALVPLAQHAEGPRDGASARQLVADFQRATAAGTYDDFEVARQYLTKRAARTWRPRACVTVLEEDPAQMLTLNPLPADSEVTVESTPILSIDEQGIGIDLPPGRTYRGSYRLAKVKGQWRIDELPDGVIMSRSAFTNAYARRDVYFLADDLTPIPDPRWIPRNNLVRGLVAALYVGPSPALAPFVTTAIPPGVANTLPVVDVTGALVSVTVPDEIVSLTQAQRARVAFQLQRTLAGVPGVARVELVSGRTALSLAPLEEPAAYDLDYFVGVHDGDIVRFTDAKARKHETTLLEGTSAARWPAASPLPGRGIAALTDDLKTLYFAEGHSAIQLLADSEQLSPPSVDRFGYIWTSTRSGGILVLAVGQDVRHLELPGPPDAQVRKVMPSVDGSRLLVWRRGETSDEVLVVAVERGEGMPVRLANPLPIGADLGVVTDIGWVDPTTPVALTGGESPDVWVLPINGFVDRQTPPRGVVRLVAGGSAHDIQVVTADGQRYERIAKQWRPLGEAVMDMRFGG